MIEPGEGMYVTLWLITSLIALAPFIVFIIGYIRVRRVRLLITTVAFFIFFVKGLILSMKIVLRDYNDELWWSVAAILDLFTILLITLSLVVGEGSSEKKKKNAKRTGKA